MGNGVYHRAEFLKEVKTAIPEIKLGLNKERGLLHMEMAVFHRYIQAKINSHDESAVRQAFEIAERYYLKGSKKLKNAIDVSLIEGLRFSDNKRAWELMPASLKKIYISFHTKCR